MANTFVKIQTVTVGSGGASTIDFTSIPQTYTDLQILVSVRNDGAANSRNLYYKINGSSTSYSNKVLSGNGSAASSFTDTVAMYAGDFPAANSTASVFGNAQIYIPNYVSANYKSASSDGVSENNGTEAYQRLSASLWSNTSAITSISIYANAGNFVQYSTATLYGIKSS